MRCNKHVLVVLLLVTSSLCWAQFYTKFSQQERQEMAEAYYLSGMQYITVGKEDKGNEFIKMAFAINPELDPEAIQEPERPSQQELLDQARATFADALPKRQGEVEALLRSIFLRYLGAIISRDIDSVLALFESSVLVQKANRSMATSETRRMFQTLFKEISPLVLPESKTRLYNLDTLQVSISDDGAYLLEINSLFDLSQKVPYWEHHQRFHIRRSNDTWLVFAIGGV